MSGEHAFPTGSSNASSSASCRSPRRAPCGRRSRTTRRSRERIAALERSNAEILDQRPPRVVAAAIRERLSARSAGSGRARGRFRSPSPRWRLRRLPWLRSPRTSSISQPADETPDVTRVEGRLAPPLDAVSQGGRSGRRAAADRAAGHAPGTSSRSRTRPRAQRYGVIVSIDGRGDVTAHLPKAGGQAVALSPGAPVPLRRGLRARRRARVRAILSGDGARAVRGRTCRGRGRCASVRTSVATAGSSCPRRSNS